MIDFLEFAADLFTTYLIEGLTDAAGNPKIPKWIRIVILTVLCGAPCAFFAYMAADSFYKPDEVAIAVVAAVIAVLLFAGWIFGVIKIIRYINNT